MNVMILNIYIVHYISIYIDIVVKGYHILVSLVLNDFEKKLGIMTYL